MCIFWAGIDILHMTCLSFFFFFSFFALANVSTILCQIKVFYRWNYNAIPFWILYQVNVHYKKLNLGKTRKYKQSM